MSSNLEQLHALVVGGLELFYVSDIALVLLLFFGKFDLERFLLRMSAGALDERMVYNLPLGPR